MISQIGQMILVILTALTVENLFFSHGMGLYEIFRGARHGRSITAYALLIFAFSAGSGLLARWGWQLLPQKNRQWLYLIAVAAVLLCYLVICFGLVMLFPQAYRKVSWCIGPAAINTVVFSMPFAAEYYEWSAWQVLGFSIGTGLAFWLIAWILAEQLPRFRHISMPTAFRGMPAVFLFLGILALGFLGFVR